MKPQVNILLVKQYYNIHLPAILRFCIKVSRSSVSTESLFDAGTRLCSQNRYVNCSQNLFAFFASLRSRRYSRARENGKLEIPPAQKRHILSSAHRMVPPILMYFIYFNYLSNSRIYSLHHRRPNLTLCY